MTVLDRVRELGPRALDAALAAVLFTAAQVEIWVVLRPAAPVPIAAAAAVMTAALAWRRSRPLTSVALVLLATLGMSFVSPDGLPNAAFLLPTALVAMYSLAAHAPLDRALAGLALSLVALPLTAVRVAEPTVTDLTAPLFLFVAAWAIGRVLGLRRQRDEELAEQHEALVQEQAEAEARATAEERRRIARELHDIVAHRVTSIVIQAESGRATVDDPGQAQRAFRAIADSGREALDELRRLLGLLRDDEQPATTPPPGVGRIDELVEEIRRSGVPVDVRMDVPPEPLPPGLDLAVFRVVQESLTNALKHGGARTSLDLTRTAHDVTIEVRNPLGETTSSIGTGRGLAGMRERIRVYGGTLTASPEEGDWVLRAHLPTGGSDR